VNSSVRSGTHFKDRIFKKEHFDKDTPLQVIDAYKVKDQAVMKVRIKLKNMKYPLKS
jgi:hypothetical protein